MRPVFRLFVSSTFSDFVHERNALQKHVFPVASVFATQLDFRFQAIDLRWGIRKEAAADQATLDMCLKEVDRCRRFSPPPNFLTLIGDRYGWRPLPPYIERGEFEELWSAMDAADQSLAGWSPTSDSRGQGWYRLDRNATPNRYVLLPRTGVAATDTGWTALESALRAAFQRAMDSAGWGVNDSRRAKFEASATHHEIVRGLLVREGNYAGTGLAVIRSIVDLETVAGQIRDPSALSRFADVGTDGRLDLDSRSRLRTLRQSVISQLSGNVDYYDAAWNGSDISTGHLTPMCKAVIERLTKAIQSQAEQIGADSFAETERQAHQAFAAAHRQHFTGRADLLSTLESRIASANPAPSVVVGASGSGKSALLARLARISEEHIERPIVLYRSIGATAESTDAVTLLHGLLLEGQTRPRELKKDYAWLADRCRHDLGRDARLVPYVFIVDAIDLLSPNSRALDLRWIPREAKVILSITDRSLLPAIEARVPGIQVVELEQLNAHEGAELLDRMLNSESRTLQSQQRTHVLEAFDHTGSPLFLTVAFEHVKSWTSFRDLAATSLPGDVRGLFHSLMARLSEQSNHGPVLVSRTLAYLSQSRFGLSEEELAGVLSIDPDVRAESQAHSVHPISEDGLPTVLWSRLLNDLAPYLAEKVWSGSPVVGLHHRMLDEVVRESLGREGQRQTHGLLARHFDDPASWKHPRSMKARRSVSELPYHYRMAERWEDGYRTLTNLAFIKAKCEFSIFRLLDDYVAQLQRHPADRVSERQQLHLLYRALDLSSTVIAQDPGRVLGQLSARLKEVDGFLFREALERALKAETTSRLRPMAASVHGAGGSLRRTLQHAAEYVSDFSVSANGSRVAAIGQSRLSIWEIETGELLQTAQLDEYLYSVCIDHTGQFVYCGAGSGRIYVWDVATQSSVRFVQAHPVTVVALAVTPTNEKLISASVDGIRIWELPLLDTHDTWQPQVHGNNYDSPPPTGRLPRNKIINMPIKPLRRGEERYAGPRLDLETMVISADGRLLALSAKSAFIPILDLKTDTYWFLRSDTFAMFYSVALSPSGKLAAAAYNAIYVWDVDQGRIVRKITEPRYSPGMVACTDELILSASAHDDMSLRSWSVETGESLHKVQGQAGQIKKIMIARDSSLALTSSTLNDTNRVRVWDLPGMSNAIASGHHGKVFDIQISRDGRRALTASHDHSIKTWDLESGLELLTIDLGMEFVYVARFTPDAQNILACPRNLKMWDANSGTELETIYAEQTTTDAVAGTTYKLADVISGITSKPTQLFAVDAQGDLVAFLLLERSITQQVGESSAKVTGTRRILEVWDIRRHSVTHSFVIECRSVHRVVVAERSTRLVAIVARQNKNYFDEFYCVMWSLETGSLLCDRPMKWGWETNGQFHVVDHDFAILDAASGLRLGEFPRAGPVTAVSQDGRRFALHGQAASQIWSFPDCQQVSEYPPGDIEVLSDDGSRFASSQGPTVSLWDVDSRQALGFFTGDGLVSAVAISPDGMTVVAGEEAGRVHILRQESESFSRPAF